MVGTRPRLPQGPRARAHRLQRRRTPARECAAWERSGDAGGGLRAVGLAPRGKGFQHGAEALAEGGERVIHARRRGGVGRARDQTVNLERAQVFGKHLLREERAACGEKGGVGADTPLGQMLQDERAPTVADQSEGDGHGAGRQGAARETPTQRLGGTFLYLLHGTGVLRYHGGQSNKGV